jgi:hypothetical protein
VAGKELRPNCAQLSCLVSEQQFGRNDAAGRELAKPQ